MQAVKEKLHEIKEIRRVKAEARAEEKEEKDIAKARMDVAHEVRLAKEAEAEMELHVAKAGRRVEHELARHNDIINLYSSGSTQASRDTTTTTSSSPTNRTWSLDPAKKNL